MSTFRTAAVGAIRVALVAAMVLTAACARTDADLRAEVQAQLASEPEIAPLNLTVAVSDGVVTLTGATRTRANQNRAVIIAKAVKGVKDVHSAMYLSDAGIADDVQHAIATDPALAAIPLKIVSKDGVVWLTSSQTNADERRRLITLARRVEGVKDVVDDMR